MRVKAEKSVKSFLPKSIRDGTGGKGGVGVRIKLKRIYWAYLEGFRDGAVIRLL